MIRKLILKHNQKTISVPLMENEMIFIMFSRHSDGSMDLCFRGHNQGTWHYEEVLPGDEINISQEFGSECYPEPQNGYDQKEEYHHYSVLKNELEQGEELYVNLPLLGIEMTNNNGVFCGFVHRRIVTLSVNYARNEIMVQFGGMDCKTYELFTWYYGNMIEDECLHLKVKEIANDSLHLEDFPSRIKTLPTKDELAFYKKRKEEQLQHYKNKFKEKII